MTVLSVSDRASAIATFRFVEVRLMEIIAAWTPTTPEMEVKVMFGRHIYDFAQHADQLGKRTFELRLPERSSRKPDPLYGDLLERVAKLRTTSERLGTFYGGVLAELDRRYGEYVAATDPILDEPSAVIIDRIRRDLKRQRADADAVRTLMSIPMFQPEAHLQKERMIAHIVAR